MATQLTADVGGLDRLMRDYDWSASPLGTPTQWSSSLKTTVGMMLAARAQIVLFWGPEFVALYNDAYAPGIGIKHPRAFGRPAIENWGELWGDLEPLLAGVRTTGQTFFAKDRPFYIERHGFGETSYWDVSYSAIPESDGTVGGVLCIVSDTSARVRAEKRREALIELDDRLHSFAQTGQLAFAASELLGHALGASRTGYGIVDPAKGTILVERNWSAPGFAEVQGLHHFSDYGSHIEDLARGVAVANSDIEKDPRTAANAASFLALDIRAHLDVPVVESGRAVAEMFVHSDVPRVWTDEEIDLVREFTKRTRAAIARRAAEQELRASEAELRLALKAGRFGAWSLELATEQLTTSEICRANFGRSPAAPFSYVDLRDAVHADDKDRMMAAVNRSITTGEEYDIEYRIMTPAGDLRWMHIRGQTNYDADGSPSGMSGISMDITERRQREGELRETEERLRIATENAEIGFWDVDLINNLLIWPARTKELFGISPEVSVTMKDFYDGLHPEEFDATSAAFAAASDPTRRALYDVEYRTIGKEDGVIRWVAAKGRGIFDSTGRCIRVAGTAVDITERKRAQEQLRELNETLEARVAERTAELEAAHEQLRQSQKLEAMGSLTGGVAHDFNNLLTPIVGVLDMLQRKQLGGEREQRLITGAVQSAERAKLLVQRLLAFARRQPLQPVPVDLGQLVKNMAELVSSTTGPQIKVVVEIAEDLPAAVADPNQLELALLNLSVNARDAMPGGGTLRISASTKTLSGNTKDGLKRGNYVCLSVADTGAGMDEATLARAVEPFFSTKGIGKGTGLGLSMVHGLASQLGGSLLIKSQVGLGTNVELWLPQTEKDPEIAKAAQEPKPARRRGAALVVDDEPLVRLSTADMLADLGYSVVEAASAEEALRVLRNGLHVDLVVSDHLMPGMTGTDLAHALRAQHPNLPMLIVTGYADVDGIAPDLPRLTKPFLQTDLADALAAIGA